MAQYSFFDLFPTPQFLLISSVGVTISDTSVYLVEFKRSSKGDRGLILLHLGSVPLPEGAVTDGVVNDRAAVTKALKELREHFDFSYVRATFPEEKAYLFTTEVIKSAGADLRDAIAFTIEENAPVHLSESIFGYDIIEETDDKVKVAVTVLPTEAVSAYCSLFEDAGIVPIGFDITPQAISRSLIPRGDKRTFLIVNAGERKTGLYVVEDGVVQFSSTAVLGSGDGPDYPDLDTLRTEIRKIFGFWDTKIDKVILSGRGAGKPDFVERLMSELGVEYSVGDIWASASPIEKYVPDIPFTTSLSYAAPVGTALPSKRAKMFGLLPDEARAKVKSEYRIRRITAWVVGLAVVLFIGVIALVPSAIVSSSRELDASARTSTLLGSATAQDAEFLTQWVNVTNKRIFAVAPDPNASHPYEAFLTVLGVRTPGIVLTTLDFNQTLDKKGKVSAGLSLSGTARTREDLLNFESALNGLNQFNKVSLPVSDFTSDRDIDFQIPLTPK